LVKKTTESSRIRASRYAMTSWPLMQLVAAQEPPTACLPVEAQHIVMQALAI
jgi:hypothetical protein